MNKKEKEDCIFCKIAKRETKSYILEENEYSMAILDTYPVSNGHTLIITKKHLKNIESMEEKTWTNILKLIKIVIFKIRNNLKVENFNILNNMGSLAYQTVFHFHIHLIPKYKKEEGFLLTEQRKKNTDPLEEIYKKIMIINKS